MKPIDLDELKIIQLDILGVIDAFCQEKGIHYSLACGTLLGAIRHQGYIPWDDDIDIYMTRQDYRRFLDSFPESKHHVRVVSLERDCRWNRAYAQAFDDRTVLQEGASTPCEIGIYIDVYPVDSVPDSEPEWLAYNRCRRALIHLYEMKYVQLSKERSFVKNSVLLFGKMLLLPFRSRTIAKGISRYAQKFNGKGCHRSFECVQGMLQKRPFDSALMEEYTRTKFENRMFPIMKNYDAYLSNAYGDYMQLPPLEKQVSHHKFCAWWK